MNDHNYVKPQHASLVRKMTDSKYAQPELRNILLDVINYKIQCRSNNGYYRLSLLGIDDLGADDNTYSIRLSNEVIDELKNFYEKYGYTVTSIKNKENIIIDAWISWENA
jgi:hypothetical protein